MATLKNNRFLTMLAILSVITLVFGAPETTHAQAGAPYEVLAEINGLRAANGLAPLVENQYLNIAAQNHANWIAETGQGGHIGEGGSTAYDRAVAVGYGEGLSVRVTENWARGYGLTAYGCVYDMWVPSSIHLSQMLTTYYYDFGAGVALDGSGMTVYVVKFGRVTSASAPPQPTADPDATPVPFIQPVTTAEPNPDGSIIHVVQPGQTLWAIAEAYDIALADLLAQNDLTEDSAIYPDQELLIVPANAEEETKTTTPTATEEPTPTPSPTRTAQTTPTGVAPTPTETPRNNFLVNIFSGDTRLVGFGLVGVSIFGIALLVFTSSRLK